MSKTSLVIGLDSSTTATKVIAWNSKGGIVASSRESIPFMSPRPGYYEQNPKDWWESAWKSIKNITSKLDPKTIKAVAISNQRETFVLLNS